MSKESMNSLRRWMIVGWMVVGVWGCDGGGSADGTTPAGSITQGSDDAFLQKINTPEAQAALQKLDRSKNIVGPDINKNKVRDDVEHYISVLPITQEQKKSSMQMARSFQNSLLVDLNDRVALKKDFDEMGSAIGCLHDSFSGDDEDAAHGLLKRLRSITFNTKERTKQYIRSNQAANGLSHGPGFKELCD